MQQRGEWQRDPELLKARVHSDSFDFPLSFNIEEVHSQLATNGKFMFTFDIKFFPFSVPQLQIEFLYASSSHG